MEDFIKQSEANNNYKTYTNSQAKREPDYTNKYNLDYLYKGPTGLKRDYDALYKALEYETIQKLSNIERGQEQQINEINYIKSQNIQYQQQFDKALEDNKALYLRCKELESFLTQNNPQFRGQYSSVIQENEELRRQNRELLQSRGYQPEQFGYESTGIRSANRMQQLQRQMEDLKAENYDLKMRLQAQLQVQGIPFSRSQLASPSKIISPVYTSPRKPIQAHENYCDSLISANEHHNRAVLERCKSIISSHNYY